MTLDNKQIKQFRTIGHHLNPIIMITNGLSDNIHTELERALDDHELIKIKVSAAEREDKKAMIDSICKKHRAILVQQIGHIALLYRAAKQPNPKLSNIQRHKALDT